MAVQAIEKGSRTSSYSRDGVGAMVGYFCDATVFAHLQIASIRINYPHHVSKRAVVYSPHFRQFAEGTRYEWTDRGSEAREF